MRKNDIYNISTVVPLVSNYSSRKEWERACWQKILESKGLLKLLISVDEQRKLVMRAAALSGVISGKSYRAISKEFFVSLQTINVVKKAIKDGEYWGYKKTRKEEKKKKHEIVFRPIKRAQHKRTVRTKYGTVNLNY